VSESSQTSGGEPFDVEEFARQAINAIEYGDWAADATENRIIRLEEIIAARWPRSMFLRRRLARELRASVAGYPYRPVDFQERRVMAISEQLGDEEAERDRRWEEYRRQAEDREQPGAPGAVEDQGDEGYCPSVGPQGTRCAHHNGSSRHIDLNGSRWDDAANPLCQACGDGPATDDGLCELCASTPDGEL